MGYVVLSRGGDQSQGMPSTGRRMPAGLSRSLTTATAGELITLATITQVCDILRYITRQGVDEDQVSRAGIQNMFRIRRPTCVVCFPLWQCKRNRRHVLRGLKQLLIAMRRPHKGG